MIEFAAKVLAAKRLAFVLAAAAMLLVCSAGELSADYLDDIGFTKLQLELGAAIPTGAGITVSQIESADGSGNYKLDTANYEFGGKTFNWKSPGSGDSSHATTVGRYFYGEYSSVAPDVSTIDAWEVSHWITNGSLNANTNSAPKQESRDVQNHSWIGAYASQADSIDALRRLDYAINTDNFVSVVGVHNDVTTVPELLGHAYNVISVGRSDGHHSYGLTTFDEPGRIKPDIVAPGLATSWTTPMVAGSAAALLETARSDSALADADNSEAIKAILLAGATKHEFASWDRTPTRPLDEQYGAGELNIYNSYKILTAGQNEAASDADAAPRGWDFDTHTGSNKLYFFDVPEDNVMVDMSAILTWNRQITDGNSRKFQWSDPQAELADMNLRLYEADGYSLGAMLDLSVSTVDNVEHIFQDRLTTGRYVLEVDSDTSGVDFTLAWSSDVVRWGDANFDGAVDVSDLSVWLSNRMMMDKIWETGDCNNDGAADVSDLSIWLSNRMTSSDSMPPAAMTSVPEPASIMLLACGAAMLIRRRRS